MLYNRIGDHGTKMVLPGWGVVSLIGRKQARGTKPPFSGQLNNSTNNWATVKTKYVKIKCNLCSTKCRIYYCSNVIKGIVKCSSLILTGTSICTCVYNVFGL